MALYTTWYDGQSRGVSRGLLYEFLVRKILEDNGFTIQRGINYQVKNNGLWCIPDFVLPDSKKHLVIMFVSHYETPSNSQYTFYETIEELFENKIHFGSHAICVSVIFGRKNGWTSWLLRGFHELFDYCLYPDEGKIFCYIDVLRKTLGNNKYPTFLGGLRNLLRKKVELRYAVNSLREKLLDIFAHGKPKAHLFDLWDMERDYQKGIKIEKELENIRSMLLKCPPLAHNWYLDKRSLYCSLRQSVEYDEKAKIMVDELLHSDVIVQKIRLLPKVTRNFSVGEEKISVILEKCSEDRQFYGFRGPGNWVLLLLIEFAGLKRNSLRNEVNRLALKEGFPNLIPYLYYSKKLTPIQAKFLSRVLLNHLSKRFRDVNPSSENVVENVKLRMIERYRNTLCRASSVQKSLIRTYLERSPILRGAIKGFPRKNYIFVDTLFRDLIPDLKGYQGKVGRLFEIVINPSSSIFIHSRRAIKSTVQHRSAEQAGISRVLRYRFLDGKITANNKIRELIFIPNGYWRYRDLMRLRSSGSKIFSLSKGFLKYLESVFDR